LVEQIEYDIVLFLLIGFENTFINGFIDTHFIPIAELPRLALGQPKVSQSAVEMKWTERMLQLAFVVSDYHGFLLQGSGETVAKTTTDEFPDHIFWIFFGIEFLEAIG
jgi:hypothetical protein